jgi:hypothetical protein
MSERISTRDRVGHVPEQKSLPKRAHRGAQAGGGPARPPQQEKVNPPLRLPDMSQIPPDEQVDRLTEYRMLAIAILLQAFHDMNLTDNYKVEGNKRTAERARNSAITFFKSPWFREICNALGYPHDSAKLAAFK